MSSNQNEQSPFLGIPHGGVINYPSQLSPAPSAPSAGAMNVALSQLSKQELIAGIQHGRWNANPERFHTVVTDGRILDDNGMMKRMSSANVGGAGTQVNAKKTLSHLDSENDPKKLLKRARIGLLH